MPRTCTEVVEANQTSQGEAKPLSDYESAGAYVLLGAPGAGKTTEFQKEARRAGACDVTAWDFLALNKTEWQRRTVFIDALDELRAGSADKRTPLDRIRGKLQQLGMPRFRLSCREADWFDACDRTDLAKVSKDGKVRVLHLNALSDHQVRALLTTHPDVPCATAFIKSAEDHGISSLLANPQSLDLLARAVSSGRWPETRQQTFDMACKQLLQEQNNRHHTAGGPSASKADMLDAAGYVCVMLLLGGYQGVSVKTAQSRHGYIPLSEVPYPRREVLEAVLRTSVFASPSSQRAPAHRQIAEYLAGRHLARLIAQGLPLPRLIALMTGQDGGVVSAMRGLMAWLAAHSPRSRPDLIERDPLGVILYGDVKAFATAEKRRLIEATEKRAERDPRGLLRYDLDVRWGDLATPDLESTFRQVLADAGGDDARRAVAQAILAALRRGASIPTLRPVLMDVVRNNHCGAVARSDALDAYATLHVDDDRTARELLLLLLKDIKAGKVLDPTYRLRGALLTRLYPRWLAPATACGHLADTSSVTGLYTHFWRHTVVNTSSDEQLGELLDALSARGNDLPTVRSLRTLPHQLLSRILQGDLEIDAKRLYEWLGLVAGTYDGKLAALMWDWLTTRPQQYKELVDIDASRSTLHSIHKAPPRIPACKKPSDFGVWCLSRATAAKEEETARYFLLQLFGCLSSDQGADGLSYEVVESELGAHPALLVWWRGVLEARDKAGYLEAQDEEDLRRAKAEQYEATRNKQQQWQQYMRQHEADIRKECPPAVLDHLAHAYFGLFEPDETPTTSLLAFLGDEGLVELSLTALRATPSRSDLPDAADIIRLAAAGESHDLALPFLAALDELGPSDVGRPPLDEKGTRLALAIRINFTWPPSRWYGLALERYPDLAAGVLIESCRAAFRRGKTHIAHNFDFECEAAAKLAIVPLLEMFPHRCKLDQLPTLRHLMAVFNSLDDPDHDLTDLVRRKLSYRSMPVVQRLHWLCFGLTLAPEDYVPRLQEQLVRRSRSQRADLVVTILNEGVVQPDRLRSDAVGALIEAIGPHCKSSWPLGSGMVSSSMRATEMVRGLLDCLASSSSPAVASTLERLASNKALGHWTDRLRHAASLHADARREAEYRYASLDEVVHTLEGGPPANAADLAALATDYLEEIAKHTRDGNTSDWRQYWNTPTNAPWTSKVENHCRDRLLSELQIRLQNVGVQAQPEGTYADDGRADIRLSYQDLNVPVEIKKSSHRDLWRAIEDQLIGKYARDPGTQGHGIYLVFWFGQHDCQRHPAGGKPSSAAELAERLRKTLTPGQARKITVVVIDVSDPRPN